MKLDPLAEIEFGMLVAVMVGFGQRMVYFERGGKRRQRQQDRDQRRYTRCPDKPHATLLPYVTQHGASRYQAARVCQ